MGKKRRRNKNKNISNELPFVSVCTPTFNRRPFIESLIKCFDHQDYPKDKMEWIVIDDGTDKVEDMIANHPHVKYFKYEKKMALGKKRNIMHEKSKGDIIVYMDDDDYYPPQRVSHAVEVLQKDKNSLCAGSSEIYIYFKHIQKMYQFGPYGPKHATAGTFAFKRELLKEHRYSDEASLAEEKAFLKNYTVPFVQLDPKKVILVFSHNHNTFDKKKLLENPHPTLVKESDKNVDDFVKEPDLKQFYMHDLDGILKDYEPGRPSMKPDVLEQIIEIEENRRKHAENMAKQNGGQILLHQDGKPPLALNNEQVVNIMQQHQQQLQQLKQALEHAYHENTELKQKIAEQNKQVFELQQMNQELVMTCSKQISKFVNESDK